MTPLDVLAKAGEIALRYGGEVLHSWKLIEQALRSEMPELNKAPLPSEDEDMDRAREEAIRRISGGGDD